MNFQWGLYLGMTKSLYPGDLKGFAEAKLGWLKIFLSSGGKLPLEES